MKLVLGVLVAALFLYIFVLPHLAGSHRAMAPRIYSNLKQIEIAKQMWAQDHSVTGAVQITERDLAPYLRSPQNSNFVSSVICEHYVINPLGVSPEAVLTQSWKAWPSGTVFRLNPMKMIPPNTALEPTPTAP
jgi:hypothetical protein